MDAIQIVHDVFALALASPEPVKEARRMVLGLAAGACIDRRPWELAKSMMNQIGKSDNPVKEMTLVRDSLCRELIQADGISA